MFTFKPEGAHLYHHDNEKTRDYVANRIAFSQHPNSITNHNTDTTSRAVVH